MNASTNVVGLVLLVGIALGALLSGWWARRQVGIDNPPMPARWPLKSRVVVNDIENKVWHGLKSIFHDHMVIVKIPVLRFTRLQDPPASNAASGSSSTADLNGQLVHRQWLTRLEGVYTTFTVCTHNGKVIGCVDVSSSRGFSTSSSEMKEALLLHCGIAYAVTDAITPADGAKMRELFLGELSADSQAQQVTRGGDSNFYSDLTTFTQQAGAAK